MTHLITVGADPETWLTKNGLIVPSVGLVPGTKEAPFKVEKSKVGLTLQEDNVSVELGWNPVGVEKFSGTAFRAFKEARDWVKKNVGADYDLVAGAADNLFKHQDLLSEQAMEFGCLPDQDAYLEGAFREPINPKDEQLGIGDHRFAGGHIHIGYDKENAQIPPWALIRLMDFYYLYWILEERDRQAGRRKLYGKAGVYREKPYGVEYRTPGNFWLYTPDLVQHISQWVQACLNHPRAAQKAFKNIQWDKVQEFIATERNQFGYGGMQEIYDMVTYAPSEETKFKKAA